jgi:acylphosphatase
VSGKVQGVFFRYETKRLAEKLGVMGWVRNLADGRVEAAFEGEEEAVQRLIQFCYKGPPYAHITDVEVVYEPPRREDHAFRIIH